MPFLAPTSSTRSGKPTPGGTSPASFFQQEFATHGLNPNVVQAKVSFNEHWGTLRVMHYQAAPLREVKVVRCMQGALYDVIVDVRPDSFTYGQWMGVELTAENGRTLYVPEGLAHGCFTLADDTKAVYFVSTPFTPEGGAVYATTTRRSTSSGQFRCG